MLFTESIRSAFTFNARMFGNDLGMRQSVLYIGAFTLASIIIMIFAYSKTYRRK